MSKLVKTRVYKVVKATYDGRLLSAYACGKQARQYAVGAVTRPVMGTKLFAFTNKKQAFKYAGVRHNSVNRYQVFIAEAVNAHHNGWINTWYALATVRDMFAGRQAMSTPDSQFSSSVVCDSIKLIARATR